MSRDHAYSGQCHCGTVSISISHQPEFMNECNCSWCSKIGALWGYFDRSDVTAEGETQKYVRADYEKPVVQIHFCTKCGCTTHWTLTNSYAEETGSSRMGVNMRMFSDDAKSTVELRFPDGANWNGEEEYGYRKDPINWDSHS